MLRWEDRGGGAHGASPFVEPADTDSEHSSSDENVNTINAEPAAAAVVMKVAAAMGITFVNKHNFYQLPECLKCNASDPFVTSPIKFDKEFKEPAAQDKRKLTTMGHIVSALVARSMTRSEVVQNDKAVEAAQNERQTFGDTRVH